MKKIDWDKGFTGIDGRFRSKEKIEKWFLRKIFKHQKQSRHGYKDIIRRRLGDINVEAKYGLVGSEIINYIITNLKDILIASPEKLEIISQDYKKRINRLKVQLKRTGSAETIKGFNKKILDAFNYSGYRSTLLPLLASKLNIKCCPYCNMHYTLVVPAGGREKSSKMIAEFQFDHFFSKSEFPLLSMSLYNLIPACANCNFSKSDTRLSLDFHPYHSDLDSKFKFEIAKEELNLIMMKEPSDKLRVRIVAKDSNDKNRIKNYADKLNIEANYSRHRDIVEQINEGIYLESYYNESLNFINLGIKSTELREQRLRKQLLLGGTTDREEIGAYPLSKFRHDIYEFLKHNRGTSHLKP